MGGHSDRPSVLAFDLVSALRPIRRLLETMEGEKGKRGGRKRRIGWGSEKPGSSLILPPRSM